MYYINNYVYVIIMSNPELNVSGTETTVEETSVTTTVQPTTSTAPTTTTATTTHTTTSTTAGQTITKQETTSEVSTTPVISTTPTRKIIYCIASYFRYC